MEQYIGKTVGILYVNKTGCLQKRTGIITAVTLSKVAILLIEGNDNGNLEDLEVMIPKKNIKKICKPWEIELTSID